MPAPATTIPDARDLLDRVGDDLGTSDWHRIDQDDIDRFARTTRDEQWIHVDPQRAADGPFGGTIAHGYLTLSLCSHLLEQIVGVGNTAMAINYGLERVRFPSPVRAGGRVRGHGTLTAATPVGDDAVQAVIRVTIEAEDGDKPACVADTVVRFYRASGAADARA